ncbi:MAG: HAD-IIB family hydrolase [Chloroflexota bacterium]
MISGRETMLDDHGSGNPDQRRLKDKMVCTDLDGTLLGDDRSMYELLELLERNNFLVVFDTGRDLGSVQRLIERKGIQKPDALICMVGTEIYFSDKGKFRLDPRWSEIISEGWHRERIVELMRDIRELSWQDSRWQTDFKISYLLKENQEAVLQEIDHRMQEAELDVKVVHSCNQFLDLLPGRSSKNGALHYITKRLGIDKGDVVVCGDSGNDLELFEAGYRGIVVGNAYPELGSYTGDNAYHATREYAAGITEGLSRFGYFKSAGILARDYTVEGALARHDDLGSKN